MNQPYYPPQGDRRTQPSWKNAPSNQDWKSKIAKTWIADKLDNAAITFAEELGAYLHNERLTTNQIRNYFGEVRRIQQKGILRDQTAFLLLKPKLAYAAKRAEKESRAAKDFKDVMETFHNYVMEIQGDNTEFEKRFKNFVDLLEAILAYHKAAGGK